MNAVLSMRPLCIDCSSRSLANDILAYVDEPAYRFRSVTYENRKSRLPVMGKKTTVALQYFRYGCGGAEKVTFELMNILIMLGYRVILYTDEPATSQDYPLPDGVKRKITRDGEQISFDRIEYWLSEVAEENIAFMVYSSWCAPTTTLDCLAIQAAGAAFLLHIHGNTSYVTQIDDAGLTDRLEKCAYLADGIAVLSEADRLFWSAYSTNVFKVINPVDGYLRNTSVRKRMPAAHTIVWCGRLSFSEKHPEEALHILSHAKEHLPDVNMVIVGDGDECERSALEKLAEELDIKDNVVFMGYQSNPIQFYQKANVLLITSIAEGFSLTLAESMQQGLPAVLYEMPYLELVKDNEGMMQVPWGDREAAACALVRVLCDRDLQKRMGEASRQRYKKVCDIDLLAMWSNVIDVTLSEAQLSPIQRVDKEESDTKEDVDEELVSDARDLARAFFFEYGLSAQRRIISLRKKDIELARAIDLRDKAERDLADLKQSHTFRAGNAIMKLPRVIRAKLAKTR